MARILCITLNPALDSLYLLDELQFEKVNRPLQTYHYAAGKGINVATLLSGLGHETLVTGFLGRENAAAFEQKFKDEKLINQFVYVTGVTRQNIKLTESSGRMTDIDGQGFGITAEDWQALMAQLPESLAGVEMAVVAGSLPQGVELAMFAELLQRIQSAGVVLAVDTSGQALKTAIMLSPDLIKPNTDELTEAFGGTYEDAEAQQALFANLRAEGVMVANAVISVGAEGANWLRAEGMLHAAPPQVALVSTVGAGDTMLAGMVHGLVSHEPAEQVLRRATAMSAHTVSVVGVALPESERLAALMAEVAITPITSSTAGE